MRPEEQLRKATAKLLEPHKAVDPNIANLVEALLYDYSLDKPAIPDLKDLTVPQMDNHLSSCRKKESSIATRFSMAIASANSLARLYQQSASALEGFLQSKQHTYLSDMGGSISKLSEQIDLTSAEQNKIKSNQILLKESLAELRGLNPELDKKLSDLPEAPLNSTEYQTYNHCQKLAPELERIKNKLLPEINQIKPKLNQQSKESEGGALSALLWGFGIILGMALVIPRWSEPYRSNSYSSSNYSTSNTAWYATGFPKPNGCGSSSSSNNCWYPVFIQYSDANWSQVLSNHCGDLEDAQSQETAKERGQIQVASFNNPQDAQGFANYMSSQYGSGWVGQSKCYY